jgi:hypothetical protein
MLLQRKFTLRKMANSGKLYDSFAHSRKFIAQMPAKVTYAGDCFPFPKGTNLKLATHQPVEDAAYALNHRPRKCLAWKTTHKAFFGLKMKPSKLLNDALYALVRLEIFTF